jgi:hypothetical protein
VVTFANLLLFHQQSRDVVYSAVVASHWLWRYHWLGLPLRVRAIASALCRDGPRLPMADDRLRTASG